MSREIYRQPLSSQEWAEHGRSDVVVWAVEPVANEQLVRIALISQNSPHWQGVVVGIDYGKGGLELNGVFNKRGFLWFWTPGMAEEFAFKCITNKGLLRIYNAYWPKNDKQYWSESFGCGMIVEEKENLLIYHCNDVGFDTNFDKLVFSLEKLPLEEK